MNIKNVLLSISLSMAAAVGAQAAPPLIDGFDNGTFLDTNIFRDEMYSNVQFQWWPGYHIWSAQGAFGYIIIKDGMLVDHFNAGFAEREQPQPWFPGREFKVNDPFDVGSSIKVVSTIGLLRAFELNSQKRRYGGKSIDQWLRTPIWNYLPRQWTQPVDDILEVDPWNYPLWTMKNSVTFRTLLTHSAAWEPKQAGDSEFSRIERGVGITDIFGERKYQNFNITVLTYLLPRVLFDGVELDMQNDDHLDHPELMEWLVGPTAFNCSGPHDRLCYGRLYGDAFERFMRKEVFEKTLPSPIYPSCAPEIDYIPHNRPFVWAYPLLLPNAGINQEHGQFWSERATNGGCHAQGGWYISPMEWAKLWATLQATKNIIRPETLDAMYNDELDPIFQGQIGWSSIKTDTTIRNRFGVSGMPWHGGATEQGAHTSVIRLPNGYMVMANTTITPISTSDLTNWIVNAFNKATAHNF